MSEPLAKAVIQIRSGAAQPSHSGQSASRDQLLPPEWQAVSELFEAADASGSALPENIVRGGVVDRLQMPDLALQALAREFFQVQCTLGEHHHLIAGDLSKTAQHQKVLFVSLDVRCDDQPSLKRSYKGSMPGQ